MDSKLLASVLKLLNAIIEYCVIDASQLFEQVLPALIALATGRGRRASRMLRKQDSFFVTKFSKIQKLVVCFNSVSHKEASM